MLRRLLIPLLVLAATISGTLFWLINSQSGLQTLAELAKKASNGRLEISQLDGRLIGPLHIDELHWRDATQQISLSQLDLDWSPSLLSQKRVQIKTLSIDQLNITVTADEASSSLPSDIALPFAVDIEKLLISRVRYGETLVASGLSSRFSSDDNQYRFADFRALAGAVHIHGQGQLDSRPPFPLIADLELQGQLENRPLALAIAASGGLEKIQLALSARAGLEGQAQVVLTPFAPALMASAQIDLRNINPAAWQDGLPNARIDITSDLLPAGDDGLSGRFRIDNRQPGRLDQQALPFSQLSGQLHWQAQQLNFPTLHAILAGQGELTGKGEWLSDAPEQISDGKLQLELQAHRLDAAQLLSSLRPTQLSGPLSASLGQNKQSLSFSLKDKRFTLSGEASHENAAVDIKKIEISAGEASLHSSASLQLATQQFKADTVLRHFDPSRFAHTPAGRINAQISASGQFAPTIELTSQFALQDSQYNGQTLSGQGELKLAWPLISGIKLKLALGQNRLDANGAFGRPGEQLKIRIDAPQLAVFGAQGSIVGQLDLGGSLSQPTLSAELHSPQLGLPGLFQLHGLSLKTQLAEAKKSPLLIELALDRLEDGERNSILQHIRLDGSGQREQHRLQLTGQLLNNEKIRITVEGGLFKDQWRGQLSEIELLAQTPARNIRQTGVAPLQLASTGWSLGPLHLNGAPLDWQAIIEASSKQQRLNLSMQASGSRIGRLNGQLNAAMRNAWQLAEDQAWQGQLTSAIADLSWLGDLVGEEWHSAGQLDGELKLAGTPAKPLINGQFLGKNLAFRMDDGPNLTDGELRADLTNNWLKVHQLSFNSPHQRLPTPLRQALGDKAKQHETPGRLEISGEFRVDPNKAAGEGALDIRLDRLAALQRADQWISLSGQARLSWQKDKMDQNLPNTLGLQGQLAVDAGYWQLAPSGAPQLSNDVLIVKPGSKVTNALRPRLAMEMDIDLGRQFLFSGAGLNSRLAGQIRLSAKDRDLPRASGTIRTRDGRFEAYGQQLEIARGILTFQGLPDNPALDVHAVRKGLTIEPGVQISGTAQKPLIRLTSDPELPDAEKLSWLILGHGPESVGSGDATVLLSAANDLLGNNAGNVVQQLKQNFGIDEFGIRQGALDGSGGRQAGSRVAGSRIDTTGTTGQQILSIGKRLSSNATLSYEHSLGSAESIVKLSVALTRQISLIGRAGSDNALDIFYTLTWGQPAQRQPRAQPQPQPQP